MVNVSSRELCDLSKYSGHKKVQEVLFILPKIEICGKSVNHTVRENSSLNRNIFHTSRRKKFYSYHAMVTMEGA